MYTRLPRLFGMVLIGVLVLGTLGVLLFGESVVPPAAAQRPREAHHQISLAIRELRLVQLRSKNCRGGAVTSVPRLD